MSYATGIQEPPKDWAERMRIEQYDNNNNLVIRTYGPSPKELLAAHENGECDMWCGRCYEAAMKYLEEQENK